MIDVPTLIMHGEDDQIVPIAAPAMVSATLVDLLAFIRSA